MTKLKKRFWKTTKPICIQCKGDLDCFSVVTHSDIDGSDIGEGFVMGVSSKTINLYNCKEITCKWYGLLTQVTDTEIKEGSL
jgi:hypothetical protein